MTIKILSSILALLRTDPSQEPDVRETVISLADVLKLQLSPGVRLKLRRGSMKDLMDISTKILPACNHCSSVHVPVTFQSNEEHGKCALLVDMALSNGVFQRLSRPVWVKPSLKQQLGADAYFKCSACGSIWTLVEPEHSFHGLWSRLA